MTRSYLSSGLPARSILLLLAVCSVLSSTGACTETLSTTVHNDTVTIWDRNLESFCNSSFQFELRLWQDTLEVIEVDTSIEHTTCLCTFTLCISKVGLPPGHYTVPVYRRYYFPFPADTFRYIGTTEFTIGPTIGPTSASSAEWSYQTACDQSPQAVSPEVGTPEEFVLEQCYPNPFNPTTKIRFSMPRRSHVTLELFDLLGRKVVVLVDGILEAGAHERYVDAANLASGVYLYRLRVEGFTLTRKMVIAK